MKPVAWGVISTASPPPAIVEAPNAPCHVIERPVVRIASAPATKPAPEPMPVTSLPTRPSHGDGASRAMAFPTRQNPTAASAAIHQPRWSISLPVGSWATSCESSRAVVSSPTTPSGTP